MPGSNCETWMMSWWFGQQYLVFCWSANGRITASDYVDILGSQVHPVVQVLFPYIQDDDSPIHTAGSVQSWFEERDNALQYLLWPAQLYDLNIIEPLWSVLESRVISKFPPLSQATRRIVVQYSTRDYSELTWVYSKKDTSCVTGKWWPNSILIKKCVCFIAVSIILSIPSTCCQVKFLGRLDKLIRNVSL